MIALITMVIDHTAAYLPNMPIQMRWIGRISAPIFIFCLCEGVDHTSNEKKYLLRLYFSSVLMAAVQISTDIKANIFRTLFAIAFNCIMIKNIRKGNKEYKKYYTLYILWQLITVTFFGYHYANNQSVMIRRLFSAIAGSIAFCEGGLPYIILGVTVYLLKDDKKKLAVGYSVFTAVYALLNLTDLTTVLIRPFVTLSSSPGRIRYMIQIAFFTLANAFRPGITGKDPFSTSYQWMMIVSLGPILMYNGQKGKSKKWFFYFFYITHLLLLWYIAQRMGA